MHISFFQKSVIFVIVHKTLLGFVLGHPFPYKKSDVFMIMFNIQYMNPAFDTVLRGHNWVHFAHVL